MNMDTTSTLPSPSSLGFLPKFKGWRPEQEKAINDALHSDKRFVMQAQPTGSGKSLSALAQAVLTGYRTCILTSTKGLQAQMLQDFSHNGLIEIKGQNAYQCIKAEDDLVGGRHTVMCDQGPCHFSVDCDLKDAGCLYFDSYRKASAQHSNLVITNYAYWLSINAFGEGLGEFDLLILDETHDAPGHLSSFLAVDIEAYEVEHLMHSKIPGKSESLTVWRDWAGTLHRDCTERMDETKSLVRNAYKYADDNVYSILREARDLKMLNQKLSFLSRMKGDWVIEHERRKIHFEPVWPGPYAEQYLFRGTPKVVLTSATVRPKTAQILGIPKKELDFFEYDSSFPVERRPVIHVPTVRLSHKSDSVALRLWVDRIDKIVKARGDRKGILHTVSYRRQAFVMENSTMTDVMLFNDRKNTRSTVEKFKRMEPPALLVSPSIGTGWDFPAEECSYLIVGKLAFPDTRSAVMQARCKSDKEYQYYFTMLQLVQMCGRGMRSEDDVCESLVIDDNFLWMGRKYAHFAPDWFHAAVRFSRTIPKPINLEAT